MLNTMSAEELKTLRRGLLLTQEQLAQMLGVHRVTITNWEVGTRKIEPRNALAIRAIVQELSATAPGRDSFRDGRSPESILSARSKNGQRRTPRMERHAEAVDRKLSKTKKIPS